MRLTPVRAGQGEDTCVAAPSVWLDMTRPYRRIVGAMSTLATDAAAVLVRQDGPAARITLNRPDKRNALSLELMEELHRHAAARERRGRTCGSSSSRPPGRRSPPGTT